MPTPTKGKRLGGSPAHQKAILSNLATSLFEHGAITTTEAKARRLRPFAEKLISKAKRGDLHNRRQVLSVVRDKGVVHTLFTEIGPRYADRPGGYTRITKIGPRKGDNAPMAVIELVEEELVSQTRTQRQPGGSSGTASAGAGSTAAAAAPQPSGDETDADDTTSTGATAVDEAIGVEDEPTDEAVAPDETSGVEAATTDEAESTADADGAEAPTQPDDATATEPTAVDVPESSPGSSTSE